MASTGDDIKPKTAKKKAKKVVAKKSKKKVTKKVSKKTTSKKKKPAPVPHFELIVGEASGEIFSGDVPVRWCIDQELRTDLAEKGIQNPHVLLITVGEDGREMPGGRAMAPLREVMSIARFPRPGKNKLHGVVIHNHNGDIRKLRKLFLTKYGQKGYAHDLVETYGDSKGELDMSIFNHLSYRDGGFETYLTTKIAVEVPDGVFAEPLPEWLDWYVNLWHRAEVEDDCHERQRMFIAIPKIIPFAFYAAGLFIAKLATATFWVSIGCRGVNWKPVAHPFNMPVGWIFEDIKWVEDDNYIFDLSPANKAYALPFMPLFVGLVALVTIAISALSGIAWWWFIVVTILGMVALTCLIALVGGLVWLGENVEWAQKFKSALRMIFGPPARIIDKFADKLIDGVTGGRRSVDTWIVRRNIERNRIDNVPELICPKNDEKEIRANFDDVPMRSVRLWYLKTKNAICKPAAR